MKMKKFTSEITIGKDEIEEIEFIQVADPTEVAARCANTPTIQEETIKPKIKPIMKSPSDIINKSPFTKPFKPVQNYSNQNGHDHKQNHKPTKPIAILRKPAASTSNSFMSTSAPQSSKPENFQQQNCKNKSKKKNHNIKNYDLMQPDDFSEEVCK